jgi:hypothetical protein
LGQVQTDDLILLFHPHSDESVNFDALVKSRLWPVLSFRA